MALMISNNSRRRSQEHAIYFYSKDGELMRASSISPFEIKPHRVGGIFHRKTTLDRIRPIIQKKKRKKGFIYLTGLVVTSCMRLFVLVVIFAMVIFIGISIFRK
jgi:hypothetical protein